MTLSNFERLTVCPFPLVRLTTGSIEDGKEFKLSLRHSASSEMLRYPPFVCSMSRLKLLLSNYCDQNGSGLSDLSLLCNQRLYRWYLFFFEQIFDNYLSALRNQTLFHPIQFEQQQPRVKCVCSHDNRDCDFDCVLLQSQVATTAAKALTELWPVKHDIAEHNTIDLFQFRSRCVCKCLNTGGSKSKSEQFAAPNFAKRLRTKQQHVAPRSDPKTQNYSFDPPVRPLLTFQG